MAAAWLSIHQVVRRKLQNLHNLLPTAYQSALVAPPDPSGAPRLIPLGIDLMRKQRSTVPYDALTPAEQRVALYAFAVEQCPAWVLRVALQRLRDPERTVIKQLQHIKASRPDHKPVHFGAVQRQLQMRAAAKGGCGEA